MINAQASVAIPRPVEEVLAFVADQTNAAQWQSGLPAALRTTGGPLKEV